MKWKTVALQMELVERIQKICAALAYPSTSAFIQEAVRRHINSKQREVDEIEQEREVGRKVLGKSDPADL